MKLLSTENLQLISGGLLVDHRTAYGITDPNIISPAVMVEVEELETGGYRVIPLKAIKLSDFNVLNVAF